VLLKSGPSLQFTDSFFELSLIINIFCASSTRCTIAVYLKAFAGQISHLATSENAEMGKLFIFVQLVNRQLLNGNLE